MKSDFYSKLSKIEKLVGQLSYLRDPRIASDLRKLADTAQELKTEADALATLTGDEKTRIESLDGDALYRMPL